jgi:glycine dehydrogenase
MSNSEFASRHIGPDDKDLTIMLKEIGLRSIDQLIDETIPASIQLKKDLRLPEPLSEYNYLKALRKTASLNKIYNSYIGLGYYNCITPGVILRNIFENPGWYTAYTPYQAEISQGRLEALLNYQTMILDLSGMEITNASLLDEATAAAEAMHMFFAYRPKEKQKAIRFFVADDCFPQTLDVLKTRSAPLGIELVISDPEKTDLDETFFGALLQYPSCNGEIRDYKNWINKGRSKGIQIAVASDLMALVMLKPPGEFGADVVLGNTQRFGVPLGYGGPHAAFFAAKEIYKREMPGRIIGVSQDSHGNRALRMALQTREQHIRRDKATSNICTAQVLLAVMASMYAVYHGQEGLKKIAGTIHERALKLSDAAQALGYIQINKTFFDTLHLEAGEKLEAVKKTALQKKVNFRYVDAHSFAISVDETTDEEELQTIISILTEATGGSKKTAAAKLAKKISSTAFTRTTPFLSHPVFNTHHSETEMLRYITQLEGKDLSLNHSMIALGSCTMKLNATSELIPLSWPEWSSIHPFVPLDQAEGYQQIITELENYLKEITGFDAVSLQPNSGAQGEYAGLMVIRAYHLSRGDKQRDTVLIPSSAHGTNPASAVMAGMKVVVVKCDDHGNIEISDLRSKAENYKASLAGLMVTYPSTHGVFEEGIKEITKIIHDNGGQVYMDGANMNAQVGLTNPATIGADVCHLNLHKTFAIPHGGGGPGMGPIGVAKHLTPFLPSHPLVKTGGSTTAVSAAPWGSSSILLISYAYIKMLGPSGLVDSTKFAILNANYIKAKLESHYNILYVGSKNRVAHEMIIDCRPFKQSAGIEVEDIAKRLMDYGFHAPTMSFPVAGTMMIEPTESETREELDRFCDTMIQIRKEIDEIEKGLANKTDNVLKNAPHTMLEVAGDNWTHAYSRKKAAFPLHFITQHKFWPSVGRVDNAYGDRNLICSCPSIESYVEETV